MWTAAQMRASYAAGNNVGIRLGEPSRIFGQYLHALDVDIRDQALAADAFAALAGLYPDYEMLPRVKSGSAGASNHYYFTSDRPFRSRELRHSAETWFDSEGKKHWAWEIELFGTGKQVAVPPSIHPDTGNAYAWVRPLDFDDMEMGLGPHIAAETVTEWTGQSAAPAAGFDDSEDDDDADFLAVVRDKPGDFTDAQIHETLALLPFDEWGEDHDGWVKTGMGLHHQFEGGEKGYRLWVEFSKRSTKFNEKDQRTRWESFSYKPDGVRFRTLRGAALAERARQLAEDDEDLIGELPTADEDDDEDLIGEVAPRPKVFWKELLDRNDESAIKPTLHNLELIARNDVRIKGIIRLNAFTLTESYRGTPGFKAFNPAEDPGTGRPSRKPTKQLKGPIWELSDAINGDMWGESHNNSIRSMIEAPELTQGGYGVKVSDRDLRGAVNLAAAENPYHPIQEYLQSLRWDGKPRLDTLFVRYLGVEDTPYHRAIGRLPLIAAVTRAFEPGHKWDYVPIIEGPQGCRKSTFVATLGKHWSCELNGDFGDRKELVEKMQGSWVLEIGELAGWGKHEVEDIKAAISATSDKVRLAWRPNALDYKRQSVMFGTTNGNEYLRDPTGGRRFWPVKCLVEHIDIDSLAAEMDQIWAEAHAAYLDMRKAQPYGMLPLYLSGTEAAATAKIAQEDRRGETSDELWANKIEVWLDRPIRDDSGFDDDEEVEITLRDEVTLAEVWTQCFGQDESRMNSQTSGQLSRAMKLVSTFANVGPRRKKDGTNGRVRIYRRVGTD